jgi:hypothetical protein
MIQKLQAQNVFSFGGGGRELGWRADSFTSKGYKKMEEKTWLENFLRAQAEIERGELGEENEEEDTQEEEEEEGDFGHEGEANSLEDLWV